MVCGSLCPRVLPLHHDKLQPTATAAPEPTAQAEPDAAAAAGPGAKTHNQYAHAKYKA